MPNRYGEIHLDETRTMEDIHQEYTRHWENIRGKGCSDQRSLSLSHWNRMIDACFSHVKIRVVKVRKKERTMSLNHNPPYQH